MYPKKFFLVFVAAVFLSGAFLMLKKTADSASSSDKEAAKNVRVIQIAPVAFSPTSPYCGFAVGTERAQITPEINGTVQKMFKNEGDSVYAGEIVAVIDNSILDAQASGSAQVAADMDKTYSDTKKLYDQKVDEAKAALKKSEASFKSGDATEEDVKLAKESVDSAKRARDLQIAAARVQMSSAESQNLTAASYAQKQTIRTPFAGIITRRHSTVGSFVPAGAPIYSLSAPGVSEIELSVPKQIIEILTDNQEINLTQKNLSSTIGFVYAKNPFLNFSSPNGVVRLRAKNPTDTAFSIGNYICAQLPLTAPKETLTVPESSILHEFGDTFVFVAENNMARKKNVTLGATTAGQTEILTGLQTGDFVVTEGLHEISDNSSIIY